jgi:hypothetical protein
VLPIEGHLLRDLLVPFLEHLEFFAQRACLVGRRVRRGVTTHLGGDDVGAGRFRDGLLLFLRHVGREGAGIVSIVQCGLNGVRNVAALVGEDASEDGAAGVDVVVLVLRLEIFEEARSDGNTKAAKKNLGCAS